jgi:ataxin-10
MLCTSAAGTRLCVSLLDCIQRSFDAETDSDEAREFDIGYDIFTRIIEGNFISDLYAKLAIPGEIVTPHQTTLLKLVDSYLQSHTVSQGGAGLAEICAQLLPLLSRVFFAQTQYSRTAVRGALGLRGMETAPDVLETFDRMTPTRGEPSLAELDVMLPKVCEALVLVTQCIISIALRAHEVIGFPLQANFDQFVNEERSEDGIGSVENIIELLRLFDLFLPRIFNGKPVHLPSMPQSPPLATSAAGEDPTGFAYLKRDLVRLLGILCHQTRAVQDRVRMCGGIPVVMNQCVVDERNPFLREHAIFALRNLLAGNLDNQAVVDGIRPTSKWDRDGVLRDFSENI